MRLVGWLLLVLVGLAWLAIQLPGQSQPPLGSEEPPSPWRRTIDGWERISPPSVRAGSQDATLHPGLVAAMQVLLTLTCFVALSNVRQASAHSLLQQAVASPEPAPKA